MSALSQAFLPANPLSIRGNGATLSNGGLIALGQQAESSAEGAVDILLNTGPNGGAVKTAIANAMCDGIILDLKTQPRPTP